MRKLVLGEGLSVMTKFALDLAVGLQTQFHKLGNFGLRLRTLDEWRIVECYAPVGRRAALHNNPIGG